MAKIYRMEGNTLHFLKTGEVFEFDTFDVAEGALVMKKGDKQRVVTANRVENLLETTPTDVKKPATAAKQRKKTAKTE